jgi:hypothetical protein
VHAIFSFRTSLHVMRKAECEPQADADGVLGSLIMVHAKLNWKRRV